MAILRYRVWCVTNSKWEYILLDDTAAAPTVCPDDPADTIDGTKTAVTETIDSTPSTTEGYPIVSGTFEYDLDLSKEWNGFLYTATKNVLNIFDKCIKTNELLRGGWYEIFQDPSAPKVVKGDYIEFSVVDKDDTLGLFSTYGLTVRVNEVQTFTLSATPTAGTYTLTHGANTTSAIAYDASDADIAAALNSLSSLSTVTVSTAALVKTISFVGDDGGINQSELTSDVTSLTGATISHATTATGADGDILELSKYVKKMYVNPYASEKMEFPSSAIATLAQGLFMRIYYNSVGVTDDVDFAVVFEKYETA